MATESLLAKQRRLCDLVDGLGDKKTSSSKRSQEMWKEDSKRAKAMIAELRKEGVKEDSHPFFKIAVTGYNYWAFKG